MNDLTRRTAIASMALACSACIADEKQEKAMKPPLKPNQVLDQDSLYAKAWPGQPGLFKLNEELVLQIPPQFHKFWEQRNWWGRSLVPRAPMPLGEIPVVSLVGFQMFLPDFEGFTPENYQNPFHPDLVEVIYISPAPMSSADAGASGSYPPNMLERLMASPYPLIDPSKYVNRNGLKCYSRQPPNNRFDFCYGPRSSELNEDILIDAAFPPQSEFVTNPRMKAKYFTKQCGGLDIVWAASMRHFDKWREIDEQIWKYIKQWNIASTHLLTN